MRKRVFLSGMIIFIAISLSLAQSLKADDIVVTTEFGGIERTFRVHVPASYDGSQPVPLILALHFFSGSGADMQNLTSLDLLADEQGFIAVFPDTVNDRWDYTTQPDIDDVGFIEALIRAHKERFNIDSSRVFVVGYENGGVMAYRLACNLSDQIRGAAVVSATMPVSLAESCAPTSPVSLLLIQGTLDTVFPWDDRPDDPDHVPGRFLLSVPDSLEFWLKHNACPSKPVVTQEPDRDPDDGTITWREVYEGCADSRSVALYRVEGGIHSWPGSIISPGISRDFSATRVIGEFIAAVPSAMEIPTETAATETPTETAETPTTPTTEDARAIIAANLDTITYDGQVRAYDLHVPPTDDGGSLPLVIALHGRSSSPKAMAALTRFNELADEAGFVVAYPTSLGVVWDDGRVAAGIPSSNMEPVDDAGFIGALIDHMVETENVDPKRVYLTGFGQGGVMAYTLACRSPERFAGVAAVASLMWSYQITDCAGTDSSSPVNMLLMHGDMDSRYPVMGRTYEEISHHILSRDETLRFWIERNGCDADQIAKPADNVAVFDRCNDGRRVVLYDLKNGGYDWPRTGYELFNTVDATEVIWRFFADDEDWASAGLPEGAATTNRTGSLPRTFALYVPSSYDETVPTPLVMALHGVQDTGDGMALITDLNTFAEIHGFIALYPDGLQEAWNYLEGTGSVLDNGADDVAFLNTLLDDLGRDLNIDPNRVYVTGFSNGGLMTFRLACEQPGRFAAFAPVGATLPTLIEKTLCSESDLPVSIIYIHGTADNDVPWDGISGTVDGTTVYVLLPAVDTADYWVQRDNCEFPPNQTLLPDSDPTDGTLAQRYEFTCADHTNVVFYSVEDGGHNWPGVPGVLDESIAGQVNMDFHASAAIWEFFAQHSLDDRRGE